jgi:hypothetical protein
MSFMSFPEWMKLRCNGDTKPSAPRGMNKVPHKEKKSSGTRCGCGDLSGDYKGHIAHSGEIDPFKLVRKTKSKAVADVAR